MYIYEWTPDLIYYSGFLMWFECLCVLYNVKTCFCAFILKSKPEHGEGIGR